MDECVDAVITFCENIFHEMMRSGFEDNFRPDTWSCQPFHRRMLLSQFTHDVGKVLADHQKRTDGADGARYDACLTSCSCAFALQFRLPCAHMVHLRESAGMPLHFHINPRWTKRAEFPMGAEFGITQAPRQQTASSKSKSMSPAEMLPHVKCLHQLPHIQRN